MSCINSNSPTANTTVEGEFNISINDKHIIFKTSHRNILECTEANDVEIHYHCKDGFCGACRTTLVEGKISYPQGEPLAYVGPNEILPCCCIPSTDLVLEAD